ncbi:MAG: threonine ammonia-lyase [Humibacillus sp.]|nr:threonine ammonia-lyase [Humibacillus sp.]MDN5775672.1 threonine ammonia-lyase [Humibacillus sp.]
MGSVGAVTVEDVRAAQRLLDGVIRPTPLEFSRALSDRVGAEVHLKCENLQRAGSFKIRGAYTRMSRLSDAEKEAGVVAASAGNHAQGVALAASILGIRSKVYMPLGAPMPKLLATQGYGATVEQLGTTIDECLAAAQIFADETGAVLVHPFDHPDIVAGQGTCGLEILEQCPDVRTVVVELGGGGLLAGITVALRALKPDVRVIGVQAETAAAYPLSLAAGHPVSVPKMATMADGIAVGRPGAVPFAIIKDLVDSVETVSEDAMARALLFVLERAKLVVEPAGAASVAWLLEEAKRHPAAGDGRGAAGLEGPVVAVLSGGNIDPLLMLRVIRNGLAVAGRYLRLQVHVPDRPGSLSGLLMDCAALDANVLEVAHSRTSTSITVDEVEIRLELETKSQQHADHVIATLRGHGFRPQVE